MFARTLLGASIPLDPNAPVFTVERIGEDGNPVVRVLDSRIERDRPKEGMSFASHFSACPEGARFARKEGGGVEVSSRRVQVDAVAIRKALDALDAQEVGLGIGLAREVLAGLLAQVKEGSPTESGSRKKRKEKHP